MDDANWYATSSDSLTHFTHINELFLEANMLGIDTFNKIMVRPTLGHNKWLFNW